MKVAVCLSGQTRSMERCLDSLIKYIIEPLDADVFFHFWSESQTNPGLDKSWYQLDSRPDWPPFDGDLANEVFSRLKPRKFIVQPQIAFNDSSFVQDCVREPHRMQAVSFQHVLSMYYSIYMSNQCKSLWETKNELTYDCVLRCRTDTEFFSEIPSEYLEDLSKIYLPSEQGYGGYNDQFAFSSSYNMDIYANCFNFIYEHWDNGGNFHPETILRRNIDGKNIQIDGIPLIYNLIR
jgi:hypothetical protein